MPAAYSYIRFSRLEQRRGDSTRRQTALRDAYLTKKGLTLDTTFALTDEGLSAFKGRNKRTGALKLFMDAVEGGRIRRGSYLIVESLDRLSREQVEEAFDLFMRIIRAGITLVTLIPETEYTSGTLTLPAMILALAEFTRAHGESLIKSERSKQHWLHQRAQGDKGRLAYVLPGWIERIPGPKREKGEYRLITERAKVVREIFSWAIKGDGGNIIARRLNERGTPCFGRGKRWHKSYLSIILKNRTTLGEFQPHVMDADGERVPVGKPIPKYFPAVVSAETFAMAQRSVKSRNAKKGGINKHCTNLFARLIRDEAGNAWTCQNRNTYPYLVNTGIFETKMEKMPSVPYLPFQRCVLEWIKELKLDALPNDPLPGLQAREADLVQRLDVFKSKMKSSKDLATLLDVYSELQTELEQVREQIQDATTPRDHALVDTKLAIDYLTQDQDDNAVRRELRSHLSLILKEIVISRIEGKFRSRKKTYYLIIRFLNGQERRVFFETPTYCSGPWSETDEFDQDTMNIRSELIGRDKEEKCAYHSQ